MELGHFQVLIGVVLTVVAVAVAILVDSLRRHNDRLRELALELKYRQEHEDLPVVPVAPVATPAKPAPKKAEKKKTAPVEPVYLDNIEENQEEDDLLKTDTLAAEIDEELGQKKTISAGAMAAIQKGIQRAAERGKKKGPEPEHVPSGPVTKEMIARVRRERAAVIAAEYGSEPEEHRSFNAFEAQDEEPAFDPYATFEVPEVKPTSPVLAHATPADRNWTQLLTKPSVPADAPPLAETFQEPELKPIPPAPIEAKHSVRDTPVVTFEPTFNLFTDLRKAPAPEPVVVSQVPPPTVVPAQPAPAPKPSLASVPSGFQDGYVLSQLVLKKQPISGLVVSIGASSPSASDEAAQNSLRTLIQSLLGPNDFAAQSGPGEFLLICPGERGAAAQLRLNVIAERLWDFQLHSMGVFAIQFSWGGVEVRSESIEEAIASATERMEETRRGRRIAADVAALRRAS